jgi:hypothetical protein
MSGFQASDLLSFDKLIATKVMKFVYFVGLLGIALFGLVTVFGSLAAMRMSFSTGLGTMLLAVVGTALGLLVWRVMCELWLLGFNMYDRLGEIRDRLDAGSAARP